MVYYSFNKCRFYHLRSLEINYCTFDTIEDQLALTVFRNLTSFSIQNSDFSDEVLIVIGQNNPLQSLTCRYNTNVTINCTTELMKCQTLTSLNLQINNCQHNNSSFQLPINSTLTSLDLSIADPSNYVYVDEVTDLTFYRVGDIFNKISRTITKCQIFKFTVYPAETPNCTFQPSDCLSFTIDEIIKRVLIFQLC